MFIACDARRSNCCFAFARISICSLSSGVCAAPVLSVDLKSENLLALLGWGLEVLSVIFYIGDFDVFWGNSVMTSRGILPSSMTTSLSFCDIAILACCFSFNSKFTLWLFILGFFLDELSFSCKLSPSLSFHFLRIPLQARIFALYYFSLSSFCC